MSFADDFLTDETYLDMGKTEGEVKFSAKRWLQDLQANDDSRMYIDQTGTIEPKIHNVIMISKYNKYFDIDYLYQNVSYATLNKKKFNACFIPFDNPRCKCIIFSKGIINVIGTSSIPDARRATEKIKKLVKQVFTRQKHDFKKDFKQIECNVKNIMCTFNVGFSINLLDLHESDHSIFVKYNPSKAPAATYHIRKYDVKLLVFSTGNVVVVKANSVETIKDSIEYITPILKKYEKKSY